jgi:poly-gamma-glutamate synthesis protein (capsule biosynthesis protein)
MTLRYRTSRRRLLQGAAGAATATVLGAPVLAGPAQHPTAYRAPSKQAVAGLPEGMALVASPRLPLFGVGGGDVATLLGAGVPDWTEVGSPISLEIETLAIDGQVPDGMTPTDTYASYDELADQLWKRPGAIALVPLDQVDVRANVLSVDGFDPLRDPGIADPAIRIGVVGDIVPGRNVGIKMRTYGDYTHPFRAIANELNSYDLTFANLEGNLSDNITPPDDSHTFSFVASPEMLEGVKVAGIDAMSLANNHSRWNGDGWGDSAFIDTIDALDNYGVGRFGGGRSLDEARKPWEFEAKGKKIGIIGIDGVTANEEAREPDATVNESAMGQPGYAGADDNGNSGTNPYVVDEFLADIEAYSDQYDILIPYFHFGREYIDIPPQWAVDGARQAIDRGATMVVTNHPHLIQGMELYSGKPIVYSVGNFIFDQMFSVQVRTGLILEITLRGNTVVGLRTRGVEIQDFNQPRLMSAGEQAGIMDRFWAASDKITERG